MTTSSTPSSPSVCGGLPTPQTPLGVLLQHSRMRILPFLTSRRCYVAEYTSGCFFFSHFHYAYSHMNIPCLYTPHVYHMCVCYLQAYAFASGVRGCTGKDQLMNMDNYDKQIFILHRKLFHRYMKYKKIFKKATLELPLYQQAIADEIKSRRTKRTAVSSTPEKKRADTPTSFLW